MREARALADVAVNALYNTASDLARETFIGRARNVLLSLAKREETVCVCVRMCGAFRSGRALRAAAA